MENDKEVGFGDCGQKIDACILATCMRKKDGTERMWKGRGRRVERWESVGMKGGKKAKMARREASSILGGISGRCRVDTRANEETNAKLTGRGAQEPS